MHLATPRYQIRPPLLDQQAFARERDWIVVKAGFVVRCLDNAEGAAGCY
jgi:hypothetical protein